MNIQLNPAPDTTAYASMSYDGKMEPLYGKWLHFIWISVLLGVPQNDWEGWEGCNIKLRKTKESFQSRWHSEFMFHLILCILNTGWMKRRKSKGHCWAQKKKKSLWGIETQQKCKAVNWARVPIYHCLGFDTPSGNWKFSSHGVCGLKCSTKPAHSWKPGTGAGLRWPIILIFLGLSLFWHWKPQVPRISFSSKKTAKARHWIFHSSMEEGSIKLLQMLAGAVGLWDPEGQKDKKKNHYSNWAKTSAHSGTGMVIF